MAGLVLVAGSAFPATAAPEDVDLGYLGCSNTNNVIKGYKAVGGLRFWEQRSYNGSMNIQAWAAERSAKKWDIFAADVGRVQPVGIWFMLCAKVKQLKNTEKVYSDSLIVLDKLAAVAPGVPIYASGFDNYVAPHVCGTIGKDGSTQLTQLADRLATEGRVIREPDFPPLLSIYQTPSEGATPENNQTQLDGCHQNLLGQASDGNALKAYFG